MIDVAYVRIWFGFVVDLEHVWNTFRRTTFLVGLGVVGGRGNSCVGGREEADMGRGGRCSVFLTMRCFNDAMFSNS